MLHKYQKVLELDKILQSLSELTCCDEAAGMAINLEPQTDINKVKEEVEKTDAAFTLSARYGTPSFYGLKSPVASVRRAKADAVLNPKELLGVLSVLRQSRLLKEWFSQVENLQTVIDNYFMQLSVHKALEKAISSAIISEEEIDDNASSELASIRRKIKRMESKAREQLEKMVRSTAYQKYLQDSIITIRDGRFVVPVKSEHRGNVPGLVHDTSASGATLFIEPMSVVEANNEIRVLLAKEQEEIERILAELSAECAIYGDEILYNYDLILQINVFFAKSNLAAKMNAVAPIIRDDGKIRLKKARHPLIDPAKVVPIDIEVGYHFSSLIITGPNTGGKTVTLKTLGLLTLMTMCGLLIPVSSGSCISIYQHVLVDIGDEQSIEQSLSTFSAHMTNIISILEKANYQSLVLIDELGSGTDPIEGAALAISIIEELKARGVTLAATTHYAELKAYALQTDGVENACCEFNVATLQPTYRLLIGVPGRSNAFAISQKLGLPESILEHAEQLISTENKRFENVVEELEAARQEYEAKVKDADLKNQQIDTLKAEIERLKVSITKQKDRELDLAKKKAQHMLESIQRQSEEILEELEKARRQKSKEDFHQIAIRAKTEAKGKLNKLYDIANPVNEKKNSGYKLPRDLKVGDTVLIVDIDKEATVLKLPDKSGNVQVQAGIMKTRVPLDNLKLIKEKQSYQLNGSIMKRTIQSNKDRAVSIELDLRGYTAEEALMDLDQFIDQCVLSGREQITIIHGKGTGVLRNAVHSHLKKHRNIRTFRIGAYGEGEAGVTIAELK